MKFNTKDIKEFQQKLEVDGYRRSSARSVVGVEDYAYWKSFEVTYDKDGDKNIGYQIAVAVYDFTKYPNVSESEAFGIQFHFLLGNNTYIDRVDMSVSDTRLGHKRFERFCKRFYETMIKDYLFTTKPAISE